MNFSNKFKQKLRYFLISNPYYYLNNFKTIVSFGPSPIRILSYDQFHTGPTSYTSYCCISSNGLSSFCSLTQPFSHSSQTSQFNIYNGYESQMFKLGLLTSCSRCISTSRMVCVRNSLFGNTGIDRLRPYATPKEVSDIIQFVRTSDSEMESKLNSMNVSLSIASLIEIFRVLNCDKVPALRFFKWITDVQPEFCRNSDICSLVIDNCGRLDDYETMRCLLKEFSLKQLCLTEKAFGFLPVTISSKASTKKRIWKVVEVLNEVGGSCCVSGVQALIKVFSVVGSFEMAKYVIKKTERKVSYYNILIKELCWKCEFKGARDMLDEMSQVGCEPDTQSYNYILSGLCKNGKIVDASELFEEMPKRNCPPDAVTYEIFINNSCRLGNFSAAFQFLDEMAVRGLEPRLSTHAVFIKGYFNLHRYEDAYKYVVSSADKYKCSSSMMYSLLASLHDKNCNPVLAKNILLEMIKQRLRPNFSVYRRVLKHLQMSGKEDLARYLTSRFSSLSLPSTVEAG